MICKLSVAVFSISLAAMSSSFAQEKWPPNVAGAWLILRAESYEDGEFDKDDPAAHGNILLLIDDIFVYACDRSAANNRRFAETPEIINSGIQYVSGGRSDDVLFAKHVRLGKCSIIVTHPTGEKTQRMVLKTIYTHTKFPRESNILQVERVNQGAARKRVQAMLDRGRFQSSTDISQKLHNWLQQNSQDEPSDDREPE